MNSAQSCPVLKLEKLLLATDGSIYSEGAIKEAINFAKGCSSKLYAVSVVEAITDYEAFSPQKIEEAMESGVKRHLESVKTRAQNEGVECETIIDEAERRKSDMIILGRRGTKGLKKLLIGEVAAKVIGHATCKVLVVPRRAVIGPRNILVATDGSGHSLAAAEEAITIAKRCVSNIITVSSIRSDNELENAKANGRCGSKRTNADGQVL